MFQTGNPQKDNSDFDFFFEFEKKIAKSQQKVDSFQPTFSTFGLDKIKLTVKISNFRIQTSFYNPFIR